MRHAFLAGVAVASAFVASGIAQDLAREIDTRTAAVQPKVVSWRRDIHQHPELSNREVRTSKIVADHLRALGIERPWPSRSVRMTEPVRIATRTPLLELLERCLDNATAPVWARWVASIRPGPRSA